MYFDICNYWIMVTVCICLWIGSCISYRESISFINHYVVNMVSHTVTRTGPCISASGVSWKSCVHYY